MTAKVSVMVDIVTLGHPTKECKMSVDMFKVGVTVINTVASDTEEVGGDT